MFQYQNRLKLSGQTTLKQERDEKDAPKEIILIYRS